MLEVCWAVVEMNPMLLEKGVDLSASVIPEDATQLSCRDLVLAVLSLS
jgi:hypothetical protein